MTTHRLATVVVTGFALMGFGCDDGDGSGSTDGPRPGGGDGGVTVDASGDGPRPFSLGAGYNPGLAIDPMGVSYLAWVGPESVTTSLDFCRLPRGAQTCATLGKIAAPGTSLSRPFVSVSGTTVNVLSYRYGVEPGGTSGIYLFTSADAGVSFGAGRKVGSVAFSDAAQATDGTVSVTTHAVSSGLLYQAVPLAGPASESPAELVLSTTHPYSGAVGFTDGVTPVVVYANGSGEMQLRRYLGTGDRHADASWSPPVAIGQGDRLHLAGGPRGLFLLGQESLGGLRLRRYEAETFNAGTPIPEGTGELAHAELVQDTQGRLHVIWPKIEASGFNLYHATSDDGGATWRRTVVTSDEGFNSVAAAIGADQVGLAAWGSTPSGASSQIHAIALRP